jgi:protein N-lysine methyltransferase METTL21D
MPLIRKNITLNFPGWPNTSSESKGSNMVAEELDWQLLESTPISQRSKIFNFDPVDLLLIVDCIYHPSLLSSLVTTIDYLSIPGKTTVLIISELRAEDVMREFMEAWLGKPGWEIWRIPNDVLGKHYAIWMGRKPFSTLAATER